MKMILANRTSLHVHKPINLKTVEEEFPKIVAEVEAEYPDFKVLVPVFEPHRTRWMDEKDQYMFYLERVKS